MVGDVMLDRYVMGLVERLNPEAPVPILNVKSERGSTGGAGNTAKNAAALGAIATLIGVVGDDMAAEEMRVAAVGEGYRAVFVRDGSRPTTRKTRFIVGSQQMLRVDHEETRDIDAVIEGRVIAAIDSAAAQSDAIIVSDYAKGLLTPAVARAVMAAASRHNLPVMADVKPSHIQSFKGVSFISPNRKEAHEYLGLNQHLQGGTPREVLAKRLHEMLDATVFLTLSEDGMFVYSRDTTGAHVPQIHRIEVADTSGCGDTAAVAIVLAKLAGATDIEAACVGNAAGAVIATRIGAVGLSREDLLGAILHP